MSTFATLKTRVQRRVIDLPAAVQAEVGDLVNDAVIAIQRRHNFRAMERTLGVTTSEGNVIIAANVEYFKEYKDKGPYMARRQGTSKQLITTEFPDIDQAISYTDPNVDKGEPEFIYTNVQSNPESPGAVGSTSFFVAPFPDTNGNWDDAGNYRIVIPYYGYTAPLVNDNDTNWFVKFAQEYIINKATAEAFMLNWDYEAMALWLQRSEEKLKELIREDKLKRAASIDSLVPMHEGARQPQVRR